ncbi:hypothetical protein Acsp05_25620 [Actinokineospora sp. NBRC 105648]|nr:hypothetical protein Acsp05_25620 [Actinokineospora sp. NBRC 105648]
MGGAVNKGGGEDRGGGSLGGGVRVVVGAVLGHGRSSSSGLVFWGGLEPKPGLSVGGRAWVVRVQVGGMGLGIG